MLKLIVLLLLSLIMLASLLHVSCFSTVVGFHTDSGGPAAVDIHDVSIVPAAAASLVLMVFLL